MRILILTPIPPYPTHSGWATSFFHVLETLIELGHEVHLLAMTSELDADVEAMRRFCKAEYFYARKLPRWLQVLKNAGKREPFSIQRYFDPRLLERAQQWIRELGVDVVLVEDLAMAPYGPLLRDSCGVPYYIRTHNIVSQLFGRFSEAQRNPAMRLVTAWQTRKMIRYERSALADADGFCVLSEADADALREVAPELRPDIVGNGTDLDFHAPRGVRREPGLLAHIGTLTAQTKLEAMEWFCRECLPRIRAERPDARLELVGRAPPERFEGFEGVEVVGRVPDVRPYLARGRVFVAPQFVGSGVRLGLLNAMATGNAIVCTRVAAEGIPFVDGEHALIREDAAGLAEATLRVLDDDELARQLGRRARELAIEMFSWRAIVPKLETRLQELIAS